MTKNRFTTIENDDNSIQNKTPPIHSRKLQELTSLIKSDNSIIFVHGPIGTCKSTSVRYILKKLTLKTIDVITNSDLIYERSTRISHIYATINYWTNQENYSEDVALIIDDDFNDLSQNHLVKLENIFEYWKGKKSKMKKILILVHCGEMDQFHQFHSLLQKFDIEMIHFNPINRTRMNHFLQNLFENSLSIDHSNANQYLAKSLLDISNGDIRFIVNQFHFWSLTHSTQITSSYLSTLNFMQRNHDFELFHHCGTLLHATREQIGSNKTVQKRKLKRSSSHNAPSSKEKRPKLINPISMVMPKFDDHQNNWRAISIIFKNYVKFFQSLKSISIISACISKCDERMRRLFLDGNFDHRHFYELSLCLANERYLDRKPIGFEPITSDQEFDIIQTKIDRNEKLCEKFPAKYVRRKEELNDFYSFYICRVDESGGKHDEIKEIRANKFMNNSDIEFD
ncbi:hypothetical protein SNEBB_011385 [Seison nebaliae]|nr:hypothetical protein SNEBB_011385 [Seison nebaliae]